MLVLLCQALCLILRPSLLQMRKLELVAIQQLASGSVSMADSRVCTMNHPGLTMEKALYQWEAEQVRRHCPHFTQEEAQAQRGQQTCPKTHR